MNTDQLKTAGILISYCQNSMVPEIPSIIDVLYALHLSEHEKFYSFGCGNHSTYIANVHLVAAAVAHEVMSMHPYDETAAQGIIAGAIHELCPENYPRQLGPYG